MNDSDQDFVDICSKLLKRSRKKVEPKCSRADQQTSCQTGDGDQRRNKDSSGSRSVETESKCAQQVTGNVGKDVHHSTDAGLVSAQTIEPGLGLKDKLLSRMQQFKRDDLPRMVHKHDRDPSPPQSEIIQPSASEHHLRPQDSDEVLAMRLQQQLDHEAAVVKTEDLAAQGLFFCHICHRDLTHMTPEGRTQHINRCLDASERQMAPPPPLPRPGVPDCPICGKKFKSHKSRSTHLKRCSATMGISPADLLQALQRQAEETAATNGLIQTGGAKREGVTKAGPARKKPRKKTEHLDEDTMVALAMSSSLLEQGTELLSAARTETVAPVLKWKEDAGKGRVKKKKGVVPRPPPILLIQDADAAQNRLQERVSALLLRSRAPSPPTPTRCPSTLSALSDAAPLWQKSALLNGHTSSVLDFFVPELKEFITPWEPAKALCSSSQPSDKVSCLSSSQTAACSTAPFSPTTEHLPANSQALEDLVKMSDDEINQDKCTSLLSDLQVSGFVLEEMADPCVSGPTSAMTHTSTIDPQNQTGKSLCQPGASEERKSHLSVALSTLASNLSSMVNNPQLSDWQLQVDSGQVFFAHSFMIHARCPLLAEMMHESGFGVHEEGMPPAQRVLISDVPEQAVLVLLQYLYTSQFSLSSSLLPHVLELASRFDLQELRQLCELYTEEALAQNDDKATTSLMDYFSDGNDQNLTALFNSMWSHEDEADEEGDEKISLQKVPDVTSGDRELQEEQVNEEELDEIYEFAATQRKRDEEKMSFGENEADDGDTSSKLTKSRETLERSSDQSPQLKSDPLPDHSLDSSYNRLFSDSEEGDNEDLPSISPHSSTPPRAHTPHRPSFKLSGRTLLQSLASLGNAISPNTSNLSIPDVSPDQDSSTVAVKEISNVGQGSPKQGTPLKPQSQVTSSVHLPLLPNSPQKKEPEMIVLSDSSEDMDVSAVDPSVQSPVLSWSHTKQGFTHLKLYDSSVEKKQSKILDSSLVDLSQSPKQLDQGDYSPELSWLVPSTQVNISPRRKTSESCTQTKSSMHRTQLFPKEHSSSRFSTSSVTFNSPTCSSTCLGPAERSGIQRNLERPEVDSPVFAGLKLSKLFSQNLHDSSKQETPLHLRVDPYSSTPLHVDVLHRSIQPDTSALYLGPGEQKSCSQKHESPEKMQLESFHLSPFSDPSDPHSSTSCRTVSSSERPSKCSSLNPGFKLAGRGTTSEDEIIPESNANDIVKEVRDKSGTPNASFEQSLLVMDEPPMAFNDSWGLDACDDVAGNPGCFSLKLEDSGGCGQPVDATASSATTQLSPSCQDGVSHLQEPKSLTSQPSTSKGQTSMPSAPDRLTNIPPEISDSLLVANGWDSSEQEEEILPLSQRLKSSAQLKTPPPSRSKKHHPLVPITPMPHYSDMDTPDLKNKLNRFGVRALPKRQMIFKLKEIHKYTHQLVNSDSEDEAPRVGPAAQKKAAPSKSSEHKVHFKEPRVPASIFPAKHNREEAEDTEPLSNSQDSIASSATSSEESERHNPELCLSSGGDSDSDGGISASQAASRLQDRLQAVRSFILSDSGLYTQILQYQPLVLSQLQERLKAAGISLGVAKLVNFLDSQCITFTTAKPGQAAPTRRRVKKTSKKAKVARK